jgi:hypothetical protein
VVPTGPRERLAAALRPIITLVVAHELDDQAITAAAVAVEEVADQLGAAAGPRRARHRPDPSQQAHEFFPTSPVIGAENPIAPPVRVWDVVGAESGQREIGGQAWFDFPYEGPPTCVHGGVIAETFDEILGAANLASGNPGMTGTLTVRYRKPTPLRTDLRLEARTVGRTGRKISTWGGIFHGDVLTAEAEGLFIEVLPDAMLGIAEGNLGSIEPGMLAALRSEAAGQSAGPGDAAPA